MRRVLTNTDRYVIYKCTRSPGAVSYHGPTWDRAGLRHLWQATYKSFEEANDLAKKLTEANPGVGFAVSRIS